MNRNLTFLRKTITAVLILSFLVFVPGCGSIEKRGYTYRYVVEDSSDEITVDDLGDIRTDGDLNECNPQNMLKYEGFYRGPDYPYAESVLQEKLK